MSDGDKEAIRALLNEYVDAATSYAYDADDGEIPFPSTDIEALTDALWAWHLSASARGNDE